MWEKSAPGSTMTFTRCPNAGAVGRQQNIRKTNDRVRLLWKTCIESSMPCYEDRFINDRVHSDEIDPKNPSGRRAVVVGPIRMDAGVAADQRPLVHCQPVRVG